MKKTEINQLIKLEELNPFKNDSSYKLSLVTSIISVVSTWLYYNPIKESNDKFLFNSTSLGDVIYIRPSYIIQISEELGTKDITQDDIQLIIEGYNYFASITDNGGKKIIGVSLGGCLGNITKDIIYNLKHNLQNR